MSQAIVLSSGIQVALVPNGLMSIKLLMAFMRYPWGLCLLELHTEPYLMSPLYVLGLISSPSRSKTQCSLKSFVLLVSSVLEVLQVCLHWPAILLAIRFLLNVRLCAL